jgi:hypothetical protein
MTIKDQSQKFRFIYLSGGAAERDQTKTLWFAKEYRHMRVCSANCRPHLLRRSSNHAADKLIGTSRECDFVTRQRQSNHLGGCDHETRFRSRKGTKYKRYCPRIGTLCPSGYPCSSHDCFGIEWKCKTGGGEHRYKRTWCLIRVEAVNLLLDHLPWDDGARIWTVKQPNIS